MRLGIGYAAPLVSLVVSNALNLSKVQIQTMGQSNAAYIFSRGTPRVVVNVCEAIRSAFGFTTVNTMTLWSGTGANVCSDATTRTGNDYKVRFVNSAVGGSGLLDVSSATEVNPATSSSGAANYWTNTDGQDNSSYSGNALDNNIGQSDANWRGPLLRQMRQNFTDFGAPDFVIFSGHETDSDYSSQAPANRALYKARLKQCINDLTTLATSLGKPKIQFLLMHFGQGETYSNAGVQTQREIIFEVCDELPNVQVAAQRYHPRKSVDAVYTGVNISGSTITFASTPSPAMTIGVSRIANLPGSGETTIPDYTFIGSGSGTTYQLVDKTGAAVNLGTLTGISVAKYGNVHLYPSTVDPLDANGGTSHDTSAGFYSNFKTAIPTMVAYQNGTPVTKFPGPAVTGMSILDNKTIRLVVTQDQGTLLTTQRGAIGSKSADEFRVTVDGSAVAVTNVAWTATGTTGGTLDLTLTSVLQNGQSINVWAVYGALPKIDYKDFIIDNATPYRALQGAYPGRNGFMGPVITSGLPARDVRPMSAFLPGMVMDFDSTIASSAAGPASSGGAASTQLWKNLIASPADGTSQSANDMALGTTSAYEASDPLLTGTPDTAAAYFLLSGLGFKLASGANTAFLNSLFKTTGGSSFGFVVCLNPASTASSAIWSTQTAPTNRGGSLANSPSSNLIQQGDSGQAQRAGKNNQAGNWICIVGTYDASTGTYKTTTNGAAIGSSTTPAWNATTTDPSGLFRIGWRGDASGALPSGTLIASFGLSNQFWTDAQMATARSVVAGRHGRGYNT